MAARKPTVNTGAVITRDLVRRYARRQGEKLTAEKLIKWLDTQGKRTKKPGGLGR